MLTTRIEPDALVTETVTSSLITKRFKLTRFLNATSNQLDSTDITTYTSDLNTNQLLTFLIEINKFDKSEVNHFFLQILIIFRKFFNKITPENLQSLNDQDQETALHYLCNFPFSNKSQASQLLDLFLTKFHIESKNIRGETILHQAVKTGNLYLIQALSAEDTNFKAVDENGNTIFHFFNATKKENYLKDYQTLQLLRKHYFAGVIYQEHTEDQESISLTASNKASISLTASNEDEESISITTSSQLDHQAYRVVNCNNQNSLEFAISNNDFNNFTFWLAFRQGIIPSLTDDEYLQLALKSVNGDISTSKKKESQLKIVLSLTAHLNADQKKQLLFKIAEKCGQIADFNLLTNFAEKLFDSRRIVLNYLKTTKDNNGNNVLNIFFQNYKGTCDQEISLPFYFLELMNDENNVGHTPIMNISSRGLTKIFKKINSSKIDFQKTSKDGLNALHYAIWSNQTQMIKQLYDNHPTLLKLTTNNQKKFSIAEFSIICGNAETIRTIFDFSALEFDAIKIGTRAIAKNDSETLRALFDSLSGDKLKKEFFNDYFFNLITNFPRDIDKLKLLFLSGFDPNTKNTSNQSALEVVLDSDLDEDKKIQIIKLLVENYADTAILKDKVVKDLRVEKCLSCFCRVKSRLHSLKINNFLKEITSKKSQDFYRKKNKIEQQSLDFTKTYQELFSLKEYKELVNDSLTDDSKLATLELIKSFKFIQILQKNSEKEKRQDDLSQSKQIKILLRVALNNDQLTPSAFRFLKKYLKDPLAIDKFSFLKNLSDQQIICLGADLSKQLNLFDFNTSKDEKIPKYCDNFQEKFANYRYSDENLERKFLQLKQKFIRYDNKLLDCYALVDSIRLGKKIEDTELKDISKKIVEQQPKKPPLIIGQIELGSTKQISTQRALRAL